MLAPFWNLLPSKSTRNLLTKAASMGTLGAEANPVGEHCRPTPRPMTRSGLGKVRTAVEEEEGKWSIWHCILCIVSRGTIPPTARPEPAVPELKGPLAAAAGAGAMSNVGALTLKI